MLYCMYNYLSMTGLNSESSSTFAKKDSSFLIVSGQNVDFKAIPDTFETLEEVSEAIKKAGVDKCGLILGIDYTMSNLIQGTRTYSGRSLHSISQDHINPYEESICILGETLQDLDEGGIIHVFGFGDKCSRDKTVFPFKGECRGFRDILAAYRRLTPTVELSGPTNFAPLIREAISIVKTTKKYHVLVILADGQVTHETETVQAILAASEYPLSIVVIGLGDGPWDVMKEFDDKLPNRKFDNFQFVDFHRVKSGARNPHAAVALAALMEIPIQYELAKKLKLFENI